MGRYDILKYGCTERVVHNVEVLEEIGNSVNGCGGSNGTGSDMRISSSNHKMMSSIKYLYSEFITETRQLNFRDNFHQM
jgi:hypothetical protein